MASTSAKFNEQTYELEIYLDCGAGESDQKKISINTSAIVSLEIEETLADWVTKGTLTVYDTFNALENTTDETDNFTRYIFRNDGNDVLYFRLYPTNLDKGDLSVDRVHWELLYRFSIFDVEDIDSPTGAQNQTALSTRCKKFYFHDLWYHRMITNTLEYSTATSPSINASYSTPTGTDSDGGRSLPTGIAIKDVIEQALTDNLDILTNPQTIAGGPNGLWDTGATSIFYTAPAANSAYDTLMDLYNRHISSDRFSTAPATSAPRGGTKGTSENDFCLLTKQRGPNAGDEGYFTLKSMSWYFEQAGKTTPGKFQIEHFYLQDYSPSKTIPASRRAPKSEKQDLQIDTTLDPYSQIMSYRFVDISPITNATKFVSTPVCSFDFLTRTYNIEFQQNSVEAARNFMAKKYISRVFTEDTSEPEKLSLLTLESSKKDKNIKPVFSVFGGNDEAYRLLRQADGLQKLLKIGVFQNACINFRCLGSTNREPGRFIAIDKREGVVDNNFNNKFFGQWFIINIQHIFEGGMYYNDVTAIKLHRFKPLDISLPGTI